MVKGQFLVHIPTQIHFGVGAMVQALLKLNSVLILIGENLERKSGLAASYRDQLDGAEVQICLRSAGEPSSALVDELFKTISGKPDIIVAIGGGSTLDTAKALAILCATGGFIADYEFGHKCISRALPVVAVPTTCGSGSEVTPYAVINNSDTGRKFTLSHPCLLPQKALIDPVLLKNLPVAVFRSGVLDALIHSLEARLSCVQNVLIHPFAEASIATLLKHFPVQGKPSSEQALHDYALASLYGGLSIAHARTGLIHTLSVAFARYVPLSHGLLNALMAPYVFNFNRGHYAGVCASLLARIWPDRVWSDETACDFLIHWFQERTADLSLADFDLSGVSVAALTDRVEQDKGLPLVNWRQYSRAELSSLIGEIISDAIR